jgi:Delta3-Delta2-enoyl-CoA isomerase
MGDIQLEHDGPVLVATMARGKANALNAALVEELHALLDAARGDESVRAVVIASANHKLFCGGLDVGEVFAYDEPTMRQFFDRFVALLDGLRDLPKPVVAAVSGHAYAGGALIALASDFRVLSDGEFGFALNEVDLGLVLPAAATRWIAPILGAATRDVLLGGAAITPKQALELGIASDVVPASAVVHRAIALARALAEKPPIAFAAIKRGIVEALGGLPAPAERRAFVDQFMHYWNGPESTGRRQALIASMKRA